ncbi:MAG: amino acid ABC transporter permease [Clostridia bacterium]
MEQFIDVTLQLLNGFGTNVFLFVVTLAFSIPLGLVITFGSMSKFKPLALLTKLFIWVMRGTPLMLQIFVVFYLPGFLGYPMQSRLLAVQIAFAINYAAYFSEIYRGGIESIPKGQYEAGKVLGMTKSQIFKNIICMQVVKRIVPSMSNEIITLVKDTSLARVIFVVEIIKVSEQITTASGLIYPLFYTGVFFLIFNGLVTVVLNKIEAKFNYYNA